MPNKDKTGPEGQGPRTGRGRGTCPVPEGETLPPRGRGFGRGFGVRGRRRGN